MTRSTRKGRCRPLWGGLLSVVTAAAAAAEGVDFNHDIQPLLAEHCLQCHGPDMAESGLNLNERQTALAKSDSGQQAIVPGRPDDSELVRRVTTTDADQRMPPDKAPLKPEQIDLLRRWIADGAVWQRHWAFEPLSDAPPPTVNNTAWVRNPIDQFVLAALEAKGIAPSPEADRYTLIKRLYFDLLGLLPPPEDVERFVNDGSPTAYETLVGHLLASAHFGERWGRHWLDMARFADSDGYEKDRARPDAYVFRDWVIGAFNQDMPFGQFTIEQLAGDLLPGPSPSQRIATAFNRQTLTNEEGGVDQEEYRVAAVFDRTETLGIVWLGLTVGCARCHNHKYDPLSQQEYYRLFAFFNAADEVNVKLPVKTADPGPFAARMQPLEESLAARKRELAPQQQQWETEQREKLRAGAAATAGRLDAKSDGKPAAKLPPNIVNALEMYPEKRVAATQQALFDYYISQDPQVQQLEAQISAVQKELKAEFMTVRAVAAALKPRKTHRFERGEFLQKAEEVQPGTPRALVSLAAAGDVPTRLDLARWLVSPDNPLTPRVAANHVWSHLFGRGLVATANDFGVRGEPPSHPELLDWLAAAYQRDLHWSTKRLIKTIVLSATYRQASAHRPELADVDPLNTLLSRQNRLRVDGEIIRDLALSAGGLLSPKIGGPSVFPPMPPDVAKLSYANNFAWKESAGEDRYRRGMYTFFKRTIPHPTLMTFDCPDANLACVTRTVSNTPLQALTLLNNESFVEAAQALAQQTCTAAPAGSGGPAAQGADSGQPRDRDRLAAVLQRCLARPATNGELVRFQGLLDEARRYYATQPDASQAMIGKYSVAGLAAAETAAWAATLRMVLNLDEFITRE